MPEMPKVPAHIANQPRPVEPDCEKWTLRYRYYLENLACWKAMKGDCLLDGVEDPDEGVKNNGLR